MSVLDCCGVFFFKQKTAYEMRISDWSSDVCSSDLISGGEAHRQREGVCVSSDHAGTGNKVECCFIGEQRWRASGSCSTFGERRQSRTVVDAGFDCCLPRKFTWVVETRALR